MYQTAQMSIKLNGINCFYGAHQALFDITLDCPQGETLVLLGPSGAGKSSLLRVLNLLEMPRSGTLHIAGNHFDFTKAPSDKAIRELRQNVGMVFQQYNLWPHLTVQQNLIEAPCRVLGLSKDQALARAEKLLERLRLKPYSDRYPLHLSGGQQQRVAIARAIAVRPRVLLLDEPLSALDAQIRHNMVEEIARLHRELPELTILYVTHDQTEALTLADKIGIMKDGSLIAHGETHQLYHYPPNRFSAEFLGRANILQATALTDTAGPGLVSVSCGGGLIAAFSRGGQHGNNKLLCIRPQHMSLAPRSATSNRLNAILTSVHWQGDLTHLLCDVAGEAVRIVMTHVNPLPRAGDRLALYFEPNDAVLIEVS